LQPTRNPHEANRQLRQSRAACRHAKKSCTEPGVDRRATVDEGMECTSNLPNQGGPVRCDRCACAIQDDCCKPEDHEPAEPLTVLHINEEICDVSLMVKQRTTRGEDMDYVITHRSRHSGFIGSGTKALDD